MQYDIAAGDVNGDGIVAARPQSMYIGSMMPPPAYLFYSQPDGGYRRAGFTYPEITYRFPDTATNGPTDRTVVGVQYTFDGIQGYTRPFYRPEDPPVSSFKVGGDIVRILFSIISDAPENCYISGYFKSEADILESPLLAHKTGGLLCRFRRGNRFWM